MGTQCFILDIRTDLVEQGTAAVKTSTLAARGALQRSSYRITVCPLRCAVR